MADIVLTIGAGPEQVPFIRLAQELGLRVLAVDVREDAPGSTIADRFVAADIRDQDRIRDIAARSDIRLVVPVPTGRWLTTTGFVNDALSLPGVTLEAARTATDKARFREVMHQAGVRIPPADRTTYPMVIKPVFGSGSRGVRVVASEAERALALEESSETYRDGLIMEPFVEGDVLGVDGSVTDGVVETVCIRLKEMTPLPYRVETSYLAPAPIPAAAQSDIARQCELAIRAMRIKEGIFHADVILDSKNQAHVIELAPRPAGLLISTRLVPMATGRNLVREFICRHLDLPRPASEPRYPTVLLQYPVFPEGQRIRPAAPGHAFESDIRISVGLFKTPRSISDLIPNGHALFTGTDADDVRRQRDQFLNRYIDHDTEP